MKAGGLGAIDVPDISPSATGTGTETPTPTPSASPTGTPASTTPVKGIDVSEYQGTIDWTQVKTAGKDFAVIRVSDGTGHLDTKFAANWSGAKNAGVVRGAYQFYRASVDATAQANLLLSKIGTYQDTDIPPVLDVEVMDGQSKATVLQGIATWVSVVAPAIGRKPIIYTSPGFWNGLGAPTNTTATLWVAHWGVSSPTLPNSWNAWYFWQYSDTGSVGGISGAVDLDEFHGGSADLSQFLAQGP